ncbi:hypothetical protein NA78x_000093 [Anatilimnocola sp. NA78]|uniref:hypothetical protein n=1 Tax=Anatilimnocola sp. NA78 TaxID=3415683 RepID=UPI003CE576D9
MSAATPRTSKLEDFLERLDSGDPLVSSQAAREVAALGDSCLPLTKTLARRLNHPTGDTAELLFAVLKKLGPAAIPPLQEMLPTSFGKQRLYLQRLISPAS